MKPFTMKSALTLVLALGALAPAVAAKTAKNRPSAEHKAAIAKCSTDYKSALKDAKAKTGKERQAAMAEAKATRKRCIADAPK